LQTNAHNQNLVIQKHEEKQSLQRDSINEEIEHIKKQRRLEAEFNREESRRKI
jgi:hypothetical protein